MSFDDRRVPGRGSRLTGIYTEYIGEPEDRTTVWGYWLYVLAYGLALIAILTVVAGAALLPGRTLLVREVAITLAAVAGVLLLLGIVLQMPIRRGGRLVAVLGTAIAFLGVGLFVSAYPVNWNSVGAADRTTIVLIAYGAGLAVLIGVVAFAPLATSKRSLLFTSKDSGTGTLIAEAAAETETVEPTTTVEPTSTAGTQSAMTSAAESLFLGGAGEGALFALYEEAPDGWDWRLVQQSVVAENDRTYEDHEDVQSAVAALKAMVEQAGLLEIRNVAFRIYRTGDNWRWLLARNDGTILAEGDRYGERDDAEEAVAVAKRHGPAAETVEAGTAFTLVESSDGWTWEFVDAEDDALAGTPRRFETEPDAEDDLESVRELVTDARLLDLEVGGFELRETDGAWSWRFVSPDDTPLVESDDTFDSQEAAEAAAELATCAPEEFAIVHADAAAFEVFERGVNWRWRLVGPTGDVTGNAPVEFDAQGPAESSARTVQEDAADAPIVELGDGTFETYPDEEGWRWRLVDDERNVLAESTHPYDTPEEAEEAATDVQGQVGEADLIEFDNAAFQLYESETEWRWRLIERDGQVVADSGEDYRTKADAASAIPRLKQHVPNAELIEVDNSAFELFRDDDGWGWRLIDETGRDLATATNRHPTRRGARRALEDVTSLGPEADSIRFDGPAFQIHAVEVAADGGETREPDDDPDVVVEEGDAEPPEDASPDEESLDAESADEESLDAESADEESTEEADDGTRWAWVFVHPSGEVLARGEGTHRSRDAAVGAVEDLQSYAATAPVNVLGELTARIRERGSTWSFDVVDRDREVRGRSARRYENSETATDAARQYGDAAADASRFTIDQAVYRVEETSSGGYTWRLVDPDRRPLVAAAESYDSRQDATEALTRFRRDAVEAPIRDRGVPIYDIERVEGGWRWRLLDEDRQLVARAGDVYPSREAAEASMEDARGVFGDASVLEMEGAAFELFETDDDRWRWRLIDQDGTSLATSFRSHDHREDARRSMATVKEFAPDAPEVTVEPPEPEADA